MSDFFQYSTTTKKNETPKDKVEDPFILKSENPEAYIILDEFLSDKNLKVLKRMIRKYSNIESFSILYAYDVVTDNDKDLKKNITSYVMKHAITFSDYIPPKSKIIVMGRSLYSITKDTAIQLSGFYDIVWNDTKFYDPNTKSWIFPTASFDNLFDIFEGSIKNSYDLYHFKHQLKEASNFSPPSIRVPEIKTEIVEDPDEFLKLHWDKKEVAWDLETGGFDCTRDKIRCITMSFDGKTGYYLRWKDVDHTLLNDFFEGKYQIGANLKFDCRFLWQLGITNAMPNFDTLHAGHSLNEMRSNSLKTHAWMYTYYGGYDLPLEEYKKKYPKTKSYLLIPESLMYDYAAKDAIITYQVYKAQLKHLSEDKELEKYFFEHMMPTVRMFVEIESQGVYINWDNIRNSRKNLLEKREKIENEIYAEVGKKFNIASSKELSYILEYEMKLPYKGERSKSTHKISSKNSFGKLVEKEEGQYLTNEDYLQWWKKQGYRIAELLLDYRGYSALLNTFIGDEKSKTAYWEYKSPNGKIFPSYSVMLANSHRNKANSPNMQQVPHHGDKAWIIRSFFDVPSEDYFVSEFDYSGLQLRIGGIMSQDENMRKAFVELGGDLHSFTAQPIFCPELTLDEFLSKKKEEPYSEYRFSAKGINFGLIFGMGHFTYANNVIRKDWSLQRCKDFCEEHDIELLDSIYKGQADYYLSVAKYLRDTFFETYPGLVSWHESTHEFAKKYGYVRYTHGGRRLLPQLLSPGDDKKTEASLKNISLNSPVQNFEIVLISRAMRSLHKYFKENNLKSRIWATVHDAIAFYIHKDEAKLLGEKIPEIMQQSFQEYGDIPIEVEGDLANPYGDPPEYWGYGKAWYEDQEVKI